MTVQAYLTWAFERLGTHRDVYGLPIEALTPVAFKRTLPIGQLAPAAFNYPHA